MALVMTKILRATGRIREKVIAGPDISDPSVVFNTFGTGPASAFAGGRGRFTVTLTTGSGSPIAAANNAVITLPATPVRVFMAITGGNAPGFRASLSGADLSIGCASNPAASTAYTFEFIIEY